VLVVEDQMHAQTIPDSTARLKQMRDRLAVEAARARALNPPRALFGRLKSTLRLVNSACRVGMPVEGAPAGSLGDSVVQGVLAEGRCVLDEWQSWARDLDTGLQSIESLLDAIVG
jgi:hypothetical protein